MTWEYLRYNPTGVNTADINRKLAEFGAQGWELVSASPPSGGTLEFWYFKRQLPQECVTSIAQLNRIEARNP